MAAAARPNDPDAAHIPVLIGPLIDAVAPVAGLWLDGTFGAGGYTRHLLEAGAGRVIAIDRDPHVFEAAAPWAGAYGDRLVLRDGTFAQLDTLADAPLDGVVLDLGVSSMQIDTPERGFSFQKDGPLDMRWAPTAPPRPSLSTRSTKARWPTCSIVTARSVPRAGSRAPSSRRGRWAARSNWRR